MDGPSIPLLDFAPDEACHAVPVAGYAVGSYPAVSPLPGVYSALRRYKLHPRKPKGRKPFGFLDLPVPAVSSAVCFLLRCLSHVPLGPYARALPGIMPYGARTFL